MTQKLQFPDILCGFDSQLSVSQNIGMVWGGVVGGADRCRSESVVFHQRFRGRSVIDGCGMLLQICRMPYLEPNSTLVELKSCFEQPPFISNICLWVHTIF